MKTTYKIILFFLLLSGGVRAETNTAFKMQFPRWGPSLRGGSVYNFETGMDGGGAFSVNRYFIEGGIGRIWSFDKMISASVGFGQDDYRFSDLASEPWNNIDNYRASIFVRWGIGENWMLLGGPSIRSYGETGVDLDDALTSAFFGGASYKFSDRLTLGPGLVIVEQLQGDVQAFPIIVVNWSITDRLSLGTGGGLAATGGPGLSLNYEISKHWKAGLTGRYEKKRFLLNDEGRSQNGVGEDESIPILGNISYFLYPGGSVGAIFGYNFAGKLNADDPDGNLLYETKYDPSLTVGIVASFRF